MPLRSCLPFFLPLLAYFEAKGILRGRRVCFVRSPFLVFVWKTRVFPLSPRKTLHRALVIGFAECHTSELAWPIDGASSMKVCLF